MSYPTSAIVRGGTATERRLASEGGHWLSGVRRHGPRLELAQFGAMQPTTEQFDLPLPQPNPPAITTRELRAAINPRRAVGLLSQTGLSDGDIAAAVGATDRSVRRWRAGDESVNPTRYWRGIDDLRAIVIFLREDGTLDDEGIGHWLRARNRELDDQRPLEVLRLGGFDRVRDAAERFAT